MADPPLVFREIDLGRHADLCVQFRADSYVCGDGTADRFFARAGPSGRDYLARLSKYMQDLSGSCVHAWLGEQIVGQIEMVRDPSDPSVGKVNLFYLTPDHRGRGLGGQLERYALDFFRARGFGAAWLRVSPTNTRALAFYKKHGWVDVGRDDAVPKMCVMRKQLA
jgi:GNAT superfamily N-acetyltransferase